MALHRSDVAPASPPDRIGSTDEVEVVTPVDVSSDVEAVLQQAHIDTEVQLMLLLIGEVFVLEATDVVTVLRLSCRGSPGRTAIDDSAGVGDPAGGNPYEGVRALERQV